MPDSSIAAQLDSDLDLPRPTSGSGGAMSGVSAKWPSGAARGIAKVRYTHEAMIDLLLMNPGMSQNDLAAHFGYSAPWISQIICSDAFRAQYARRRDQVVDPTVLASVKEQFEGLANRCLEVLRHKLRGDPENIPEQLALQTLKISATSLGYGARPEAPKVQININAQLEELGLNLERVLAQKRGRTFDAPAEGFGSAAPQPATLASPLSGGDNA